MINEEDSRNLFQPRDFIVLFYKVCTWNFNRISLTGTKYDKMVRIDKLGIRTSQEVIVTGLDNENGFVRNKPEIKFTNLKNLDWKFPLVFIVNYNHVKMT